MEELSEGDEFECYDEFALKLSEHGRKHNVQWIKHDSRTVESANKHLSEKVRRYDRKFKYRCVKFVCKHGGINRSSSKGLRPNQRSYKMECPAFLYVTLDREKDRLVVRRMLNDHNHPTDKQQYMKYPQQRRLDSKELETVEEMLKKKVKVKHLQEHLQSQGIQFVTARDLHNIRQRMHRKLHGNQSDEEVLIDELKRLGDEDLEPVILVQVSDIGELLFLLIVTEEMKKIFSLFPEVLMIDGTYKINKLRIPLYLFLIEDGNRQGRVVGICFVADEKKDLLVTLMEEFGRVHNLENLKYIIVNKDLNEILALENVMPNVSIQLCKFHVMQCFRDEIQKIEIGQVSKIRIIGIVQKLVFAPSKSFYDSAICELVNSAPQSFMDYFQMNWGKEARIWTAFETHKHINLGNTTTIRIESINQKIEDVLNRSMSVADAVKGFMILLRSMNYSVSHKQFNQNTNTGMDQDEIEEIKCTLTSSAVKIVLRELQIAKESPSDYIMKNCGCTLKQTFGLPCRHLFSYRMQYNHKIFEKNDCSEQWFVENESEMHLLKRQPEESFTTKCNSMFTADGHVKKLKSEPKTNEEKYRDVMLMCQSIADLASGQGTEECLRKIEVLSTLYKLWVAGKNVVVLDADEMENMFLVKTEERFGDRFMGNDQTNDGLGNTASFVNMMEPDALMKMMGQDNRREGELPLGKML